jgi:glycogen debranching enzyme
MFHFPELPMNRASFVALSVFSMSSLLQGQVMPLPSFSILHNNLEVTRLAQPYQYFDKIGTQAGIMGYESGTLEAWIWPWKPLRNFELWFLLGTSTQPIRARDIVRTISATPEATVFTYAHESFTVRETIIVPRGEPGVILLLGIHTTSPLTIVAGFLPVMQPMWPAGIGGQFSYWDDDAHSYVISEGRWRAVFLCGSPRARQMASPPAHMFADDPLQFRIDVTPGETDTMLLPIVIAGGPGMSVDSVRSLQSRLWWNAERYYRENAEYYQTLRDSTLQVITPRSDFNLAFEWGKVALDNLMIRNPVLGRGLVAGFGLSGGGARPGFAWFFGGDAFINALAFNSFGAFPAVKDALAFTQRWQRQENFPVRKKKADDPPKDVGKMAHELSQSDGLCDWWNDYHYGYNHADTTPWYLVAMGDYVRTSGDVEFLRASWQSVKLAYEWCLSKDSDGDGLMDLKGAGLGALEFGKLVGIYADVYTCGVWVQGIREMRMMAELMGDTEIRARANVQWEKARVALEKKFWMEQEGIYSYGATEKGEQVRETTPWGGVGMMFGLFDSARTGEAIAKLNSAEICTDWGVRSLARSSSLFEPTNYNYGAVWPFIGSFFNTAQFRYGSGLPAFQVLESTVAHAMGDGIGVVPEVFSGEMNQKLGEAYHHQGFSTTGYMLPFVRGLLGLEVDAVTGTLEFSPVVPADWDSLSIRHIALGAALYDLTFTQSDSVQTLTLSGGHSKPLRLMFTPALPPGARLVSISVNGSPPPAGMRGLYELQDGDQIRLTHTPVPVVLPPHYTSEPGSSSEGIRIISCREAGKRIRVRVEGRPGRTYRLPIAYAHHIGMIEGAMRAGEAMDITFDKSTEPGFHHHDIFITPK